MPVGSGKYGGAAGMASIRIELFNNLLITCAQQPVVSVNTNRLQSLLAWLILHSESAQSREQLAFLLWPESSESQARTNLRQLLHHLRRALPARIPGSGVVCAVRRQHANRVSIQGCGSRYRYAGSVRFPRI